MKQHGHNRIDLIRVLSVSFCIFQSLPLQAEIKFGEPVNMGPLINSPQTEGSMITSADGSTRYFTSGRPGGYGSEDIWEVTRATINDPWSSPKNLGPEINSSSSEGYISFGPDELTLFLSEFCYSQIRPGGIGGRDVWISTRQSVQEPWSTPVNMGSVVNSSYDDYLGSVSTDGLELYFFSTRPGYGERDLWVTSRASLSSPWQPPVNLGSTINSPHHDTIPVISQDGLTLCFASTRPGGLGSYDIYRSTRLTKDHPWGSPTHLPQLCGPMIEGLGGFDPLSSCLSLLSNRSGTLGGFDLWSLPVIPVVDFNGDGIVDSADLCIMVDHWGTDNSLCDIGPMPWGDGIVDVQDLIVLAEHLFEGTGLTAHWALDETEGDVAYDSAGNIDATVHNGQWTTGKIDGALLLNGLTTYMDCGDSQRLGTPKMTLAMWLAPEHMGGMRYVLSRAWEGSDEFDYVLMRHYEGQVEFAVAQEGSDPASVTSNATTPLSEWTHVAVCADGSEAAIYINGQLDASAGYARRGLSEGCRLWISSLGGRTRFFNGKIDDVRIYNIALSPEEIAALAQ